MCLSPRPLPRVLSLGEAAKVGFRPVEADSQHGPSLPENLISSSTSSGKALVTTELDVLVCNTFSRGGRTQCVSEGCDTSSCEAPRAETHRLKLPAPPPEQQQEFNFKTKKLWLTLLTVAPVALFLCTCKPRQMRVRAVIAFQTLQ